MLAYRKRTPDIILKILIFDFYLPNKKSVSYFDVANAFFFEMNNYLIRKFFLGRKDEIQSYKYEWNT